MDPEIINDIDVIIYDRLLCSGCSLSQAVLPEHVLSVQKGYHRTDGNRVKQTNSYTKFLRAVNFCEFVPLSNPGI